MRALLVLFGLSLLFIALLEPPPRPNLNDNAAVTTTNALYQLHNTAARDGWTDAMHREAGTHYRTLGDTEAAAFHWRAMTDPDAALVRQLVNLHLELQDWSALVEDLQQLAALTPDDAWVNYQLGLALAASQPYAAIDYLRPAARDDQFGETPAKLLRVILNDPADPLISFPVGLVLLEHDHWSHAEQAFQLVHALTPEDPETLAYIALTREKQGKSSQFWLDEALRLGASIPQVHYVQGLILREQGATVESSLAFAQAAALDPGNPAYYAELGESYRRLLEFEMAEYWLRVALAVSNNDPQFQSIIAEFYAEAGYTFSDESLATAQQSANALPADPELLAGFAYALHTMGDTDGALSTLASALDLAPENAAVLYYEARVLHEIGNTEEAITLMQRVTESTSEYALPAADLLQQWNPG